jgi:hypothetical protein
MCSSLSEEGQDRHELPSWWCNPDNFRSSNYSPVYISFSFGTPLIYDGSCMERLCLDPALEHARKQVLLDVSPKKAAMQRLAITDTFASDQDFLDHILKEYLGYAEACAAPLFKAVVFTVYAYLALCLCLLTIVCRGLFHGFWTWCRSLACWRKSSDGSSGNLRLIGSCWLSQTGSCLQATVWGQKLHARLPVVYSARMPVGAHCLKPYSHPYFAMM